MTQWTTQQLKCLEAIGVPVYTHVPTVFSPATADDTVRNTAVATDTSAEIITETIAEAKKTQPHTQTQQPDKPVAKTDTESNTASNTADAPSSAPSENPVYYKLGPWVLEFSSTIPVESYDWLRDLAAYCKSKPAQVNQTSNAVRIENYARNKLNAADKKNLWKTLKAHL